MLYIDIDTYHYDNDHFQWETKVLGFGELESAYTAQAFFKSLEYEDDDLLTYWGKTRGTGKSAGIPCSESHPLFARLDIWHGCIIETKFRIYRKTVSIRFVD